MPFATVLCLFIPGDVGVNIVCSNGDDGNGGGDGSH